MADNTLAAVSTEQLDDLAQEISNERERRSTLEWAENEAGRLATTYVEAGGIFDALIAAMCDALEKAAEERLEKEANEQMILAAIP